MERAIQCPYHERKYQNVAYDGGRHKGTYSSWIVQTLRVAGSLLPSNVNAAAPIEYAMAFADRCFLAIPGRSACWHDLVE